jgi:DNA end-binding protein Ku
LGKFLSMWKGAVSFGLVTVPIELYAATEDKNVSLRQVHQADAGRNGPAEP